MTEILLKVALNTIHLNLY